MGCTVCPPSGMANRRADFVHLMLICPVISDFYKLVVYFPAAIKHFTCTPEIGLLGLLDEDHWPHYTRIFLRGSLFMAHKIMAVSWINPSPLRASQWKLLVLDNSVLEFMYEI